MAEKIAEIVVLKLQQSVINFVKYILLGLIQNSYWICLVACLLALILYVAGMKKAGKYVKISFIIYFIFQAIKSVIL